MPLRWITATEDVPDGLFEAALREQYAALGIATPTLETSLSVARDASELLLFHGKAQWGTTLEELDGMLAEYAADALHLIPVIEASAHATTHLPKAIQKFNAFIQSKHGDHWPDALVDEVLTLLWQRRRERKIFISYRRAESEAVAQQLFKRYTALGFDVFLDDVSIPVGVDFQLQLRRQLDSSDALIALFSPAFTNSRWVREELELAMTRRVGILGIVWPSVQLAPDPPELAEVPVDCRLSLAAGNLTMSAELDASALESVDHLVYRGRAQSIAARLRDLVDVAQLELSADFNVTAVSPRGDLELVEKIGGKLWVGRIVPFRPSLEEVWTWQREVQLLPLSESFLSILSSSRTPRRLLH